MAYPVVNMVAINAPETHEEWPIDSVGDDEFTAMPRPLVIDSGADETVTPADWFSSHAAQESEGGNSGAYCRKRRRRARL